MENFHALLKFFFRKANITQQDIADRLGVSSVMVSYYLNGQRKFGANVAKKWADAFSLDAMWLMTQGEQGTPPDELPAMPQQNGTPIVTDLVGYLGTPNADGHAAMMPYEVTGHMNVPGVTGTVFLQVVGDSMTDGTEYSIPHGSYVALREYKLSSFRWGEVYALVTDDGVLVKKVMPGKDEAHIVCQSLNSEKYPPFVLNGSEIKAVWRVCGVVMIRAR